MKCAANPRRPTAKLVEGRAAVGGSNTSIADQLFHRKICVGGQMRLAARSIRVGCCCGVANSSRWRADPTVATMARLRHAPASDIFERFWKQVVNCQGIDVSHEISRELLNH